MKLNLGCGKKLLEGFMNIDIQNPCDLLHDLRFPLPYENSSVEEVYSANFIHTFSRKDWRELKKEMIRVLKSGGKLELILHDFDYILSHFLSNDEEKWDWWLQTIYGAQFNEYDYIKNGFTYEKLKAHLHEEGMINFEEDTSNPEYIHLISYKQ